MIGNRDVLRRVLVRAAGQTPLAMDTAWRQSVQNSRMTPVSYRTFPPSDLSSEHVR